MPSWVALLGRREAAFATRASVELVLSLAAVHLCSFPSPGSSIGWL